MEVSFSPTRVAKFIGLLILSITVVSFSMNLMGFFLKAPIRGYRLVNLEAEQTIPAWYSSSLLLLCAGLLAVIAHVKNKTADPFRFHWSLLSLIFAGLSLDETVSLHEEALEPLRSTFNLTGLFYFSWVIVGIAFICVFTLVYLRFLIKLPKQIRNLFFLSGVIYVSGSVGLEMIGGMIWESLPGSLFYQILMTIEELLEMLGINLFIYALMTYLASYLTVRVSFEPEKF